jgi:glycerol kinase
MVQLLLVSWTEQDPEEIFSNIMSCLDTAAADLVASGHSTANIKAVGITNQRETSIVWDKFTGKPLYPAIGNCTSLMFKSG